ncbi:Uncharacterized protein FKW44_009939, partial [Caligus rogercresseyi]
EVIEFFNYPKSTVYDQWKAWNSFKKNDAHRKKRSRSLGATRTDEFVAEVKRKVNEDGNKSYANRPLPTPSTRTWAKGLGSRPQNLPYHWSPDLWPPAPLTATPSTISSEAWSRTRPTSTLTTFSTPSGLPSRFRHRLEMVVAADGGYIEK